MGTPVTLVEESGGKALGTPTNPIRTQGSNQLTANAANSSTTPLANGGVFTGTAFDTSGGNSIVVDVFTSHASATDGLSIEQSIDGTNWDITDKFTVAVTTAGNGKTYAVQVVAPYGRVVYTNGGTLQTTFRLAAYVKNGPTDRSVRPADSYSNENDFGQNQSFEMVLNPAGTWDRRRAGPYQVSQTPLIAGSGNVANASAAATLTGTSTTTVHISGFEITGAGATAGAAVTVTVAGLLGGSRLYTYAFATGAVVGNTPLVVQFDPPLPASAVNTPISVTCPAGGTGALLNTVVAHGFYQ